jgi:DNA polymerase elongation subunit (family B)
MLTVRFQHLDTLYRKEHVCLFGRALDGRSVAVVQQYKPSIIVNRRLPRLRELAIGHMLTRVFGNDDEFKRPRAGHLRKQLEEVDTPRCQVLQGQDLCAYDETQTHTFYKYTFPSVKMYYAVRALLSGPVWIATLEGQEVLLHQREAYPGVEQYNTQVNIGMQYMIENNLMSSGVFEVTGESRDGMTTCQLEFLLPPSQRVVPVDTPDQAPLHILSYDLECNLRMVRGKLVFPVPEVDPIITIGVVTSSGKTVFCLHDVDPIEDVDVHHFHTEVDMLRAFNTFVAEYDPDFIIGHNVNRFDNVYYEKRCLRYDVKMTWSRLNNYVSKVRKIVTQSNQKGTREVFRLDIPGRVVLDSYEKFREDHNLRSYKLDELGKHFLKQQKFDMPYAEIPIKFKTRAGRTEIADYCVQDSHLVYELVRSQCKILNVIGLANVTGVTAKDILQRGQGIRTISLMIRYCLRNEPMMFVPKGQNSEHEFQGAVVLPPIRGKYDDAVVCVDFASLYPSIMQAMNMCYSTLVVRNKIDTMDWVEDEHVRTVPDYEMGERLKIIFNPTNVSFVTTTVREGILPKILNDVLNERRAVKKQMKKHYGTPHYGVLNGRQLALKVTANSVYGFTGAKKGFLPEPRIASSVTKYGRGLTLRTMDMVDNNPAWKGSKVIYGDSVTHDTPLLLRFHGILTTMRIDKLADKNGATWEKYGDKERAILNNVEIWSDKEGGFGWTKVECVIRHRTEKEIFRVCLPCGMVDVTEDHSLLDSHGIEITPEECMQLGDDAPELMVSNFPPVPENMALITYDMGYDIGASLFRGGDGLYATSRAKRVPPDMLTAPRAAVFGFLDGISETTCAVTETVHKELLHGIAYLAQRAERYFRSFPAPISRSKGLYRFMLGRVRGAIPPTGKLQKVYSIGKTKNHVYDLTTASHHFAVGPGKMIVHNTDSCFIHLSRAICDGEDSKALVERAHIVGEQMANEITQQFLHPVLMEYENAFEPPFYLLKKKRYLGKRVLPGRAASTYIKGCECIRRDFAPLVVDTQRAMIDLLLENKVDDAIALVRTTYTDLYAGKIPLEKLILSKKLSQLPENYRTKAPHVQLAIRLKKQCPEKAPVAGDRVEYVIRTGREQLFDRAISPSEVDQHTIDYAYYAEKQLKQPLARIMELVCDANTLFPYTPLTIDVNKEHLKRLGVTATRRTVTKRRRLVDVDKDTCAKMATKDIRKFFNIST